MGSMLNIEGLSREFSGLKALDNLTFSVQAGEFIGVIGRSGAGKSTLLRSINRLVDPTAGRVIWNGVDVTALRGRELRLWRARCAMVFQQFNLAGRLDVLTNVLVGRLSQIPAHRALLRLWSDEDRAIAFAALEMLDMAAFSGQRAERLSGGQQQRVAIARALVQEPQIILADEPVASLDPRNTRVVMDALASINSRYGITVLCNLHSLDLARHYCSRLIGLASGRLVFDGTPSELTDAVAHTLYGIESNEVVGRPANVQMPARTDPPARAALA
jgi:phosphonate transport system ATP-binding protein